MVPLNATGYAANNYARAAVLPNSPCRLVPVRIPGTSGHQYHVHDSRRAEFSLTRSRLNRPHCPAMSAIWHYAE
jgi:hypothetical protein